MKIFKIRVVSEKGEDSLIISKNEILIGRSLESDVTFNWKGVSRNHANIFLRDGSIWIKDLGSKLGTKVNDESLVANEEFQYTEGSLIYFGSLSDTVCVEAIKGEAVEEDSPEGLTEDDFELTLSKISNLVFKKYKDQPELDASPELVVEVKENDKDIDKDIDIGKENINNNPVDVKDSLVERESFFSRIKNVSFSRLFNSSKEEDCDEFGVEEEKIKETIEHAKAKADLIVEKARWKAENIIKRAKEKAKKIKNGENT